MCSVCDANVCVLCAVAPCSHVPGSVLSACGPSCPRSCDDLSVSPLI